MRTTTMRSRTWTRLRRAAKWWPTSRGSMVPFTCNICGKSCRAGSTEFGRETPSCPKCNSTVRMRSIIHALSTELFAQSLALPDFPVRKEISGIGMSDWETYADGLAKKLAYRNTYYHRPPKLDICDPDPDLFGSLDFVISSDVFEHVAPPATTAFENTWKLLKPGGVLIFTVPYNKEGPTLEHFPDLFDFELTTQGNTRVLVNRTRSGAVQTFRNLTFHGGEGETLEMRVFSLPSLLHTFNLTGFQSPKIYGDTFERFGIFWDYEWSLPMSVRKLPA